MSTTPTISTTAAATATTATDLFADLEAHDTRGKPQSGARFDIAVLCDSADAYHVHEHTSKGDALNYAQNARNAVARSADQVKVIVRGLRVYLVDLTKLTPEEAAKL